MDEDAVVGVTSNPTIFQKAISQGDAYDEQVKMLLEREQDPKEIFLHLAVRDVESALDLLAPVHERDPQDGYVSIEVDPTFAYDTKATYEEAIRLHDWIRRPNLYVKIPGTKPGLQAIEDCIASGRSINVTLLFSLEMHSASMEAYLSGLERFAGERRRPDESALRRKLLRLCAKVDTETDKPAGGDRLRRRARASRQARGRERAHRIRMNYGEGVLGLALEGARRPWARCRSAAHAGLHLHEESRVPRRPLRRGSDPARTR